MSSGSDSESHGTPLRDSPKAATTPTLEHPSPADAGNERTADDPVEAASEDRLSAEYARVGTLLAERYKLLELIGLGGMGAVYRAEHVRMRKEVAIKVLHTEMTALPDILARFEREAIAAGRIEHPNVVQARDFGRIADGTCYLVLEYVDGRTLSDLLKKEVFDVPRSVGVGLQVARALEAAHAESIVHRDLKPENVMLVKLPDGGELVKVLDFGIAKVNVHQSRSSSDTPITKIGVIFGTPEYMSPEQASGQLVDSRGDLYSLGLLMYRMLAGKPAFTAATVSAVLMKQITQTPDPLPQSVPPAVRDFVLDLLRKDPDERIQTASEAVHRLYQVLAAEGWVDRAGDSELAPPSLMAPAYTPKAASPGAHRGRLPSFADRLDESAIGWGVTVLGNRIPLWRFVILAGIISGLAYGLHALLEADPELEPQLAAASQGQIAPPSQAVAASAVTPAINPIDAELERNIAQAFAGDPEAAEFLEARPAEERGVREWLALGRAYAKNDRDVEALVAYEEALKLDPSVAKDARLLRDVSSASRREDSVIPAIELAAAYLGTVGADLLYRVWVQKSEVTPASTRARELLFSSPLREQASPALAFLLDWRSATSCKHYQRLLPKAAVNADARAETLLVRTEKENEKTVCVPKEALEAAILAVKERPAPILY